MKSSFSALKAQKHFAVLPIIHRGGLEWLPVGYQCVMEGQGVCSWWIRHISDLVRSCKCIATFTLVALGTCIWANSAATLWRGPYSVAGVQSHFSVTKDNEFCGNINRHGAVLQMRHLYAT